MNLTDYPAIPSDEAIDSNAFSLLKFQIMTSSQIPAHSPNASVGAVELLEGHVDESDRRVYLLQTSLAFAQPVLKCESIIIYNSYLILIYNITNTIYKLSKFTCSMLSLLN